MTEGQYTEHPWWQPHRLVIIGVIAALVVVGLVLYHFHRENVVADQKADQLTAALHSAGLPAPSHDTITRVLGDDGGAVCEDPGNALHKALLDAQLVNGAAFVGQRPILASTHLIKAETVVLRIYCPDKIAEFQDSVGNYHLDEVTKE